MTSIFRKFYSPGDGGGREGVVVLEKMERELKKKRKKGATNCADLFFNIILVIGHGLMAGALLHYLILEYLYDSSRGPDADTGGGEPMIANFISTISTPSISRESFRSFNI